MYENITFEMILDRMLDRIPDIFDKREGSIIYNSLAPAAIELQLMYIELDTILNETFADTATRQYLIKRAKERGLAPYSAKAAILKGIFSPIDLELNLGQRFSLNNLNYKIIGKITQGVYRLECETAGSIGNKFFGDLIPIDYVDGLRTASIVELLIPGIDEEETEDFRKRYFDSFSSQAFGGNIADYKAKVKAMQGVGGLKVTPTWQGAGTVKLTILSSDYNIPTDELIKTIKQNIDPKEYTGQGYGIAPIGHIVTVESVTTKEININTNITYQANWNFESCKPYIEHAIDKYFLELAKVWENESQLIVRVSQIETRILNVEGVLDIQNTTLNGKKGNELLEFAQIPKRGEING